MTSTSFFKRVPIFFFTLLFASFVGCAGSAKQESTGEFVDDATLTTKVKTALIQNHEVKARDITVETFKGTVQLSGFADSLEEKTKAVEVARSVQGVKSVKDDIRLKSAGS